MLKIPFQKLVLSLYKLDFHLHKSINIQRNDAFYKNTICYLQIFDSASQKLPMNNEKSKHFLCSLKDFVNLAEIVSESGRKNVFAVLKGNSRSGLLFAAERFCTAQSAVNVGADDSVRPSPPQRKMKKPLSCMNRRAV